MNCQEFWDDLPRQGHEITGEQAGHLAECGACAAQWQPHGALAARWHTLAEEWRRVEAPPRVEAGLQAAFRAQAGFRIGHAIRHSWWTPVLAWASAAAAMMALAVLLLRGYQPGPATPGTIAAPHRTVQTAVEMAALDSDDDSALGEGFVRLPNRPPIEPNEEFYVLHVEAPGAYFIAMGVAVSEDRASETLLADVAYGFDGTSRAVRLVSDGGTN